MKLPKRYPYAPRWRDIFAVGLFFAACSAIIAYEATRNKAGVIINGIITLGPTGATVFNWIMAGGSAVFVLIALLAIVRRLTSNQVLEVGTDALVLPQGFLLKRSSRILYAEIEKISELRVKGQTVLYLTARGRRFTISASLLPDTASYLAVKEWVCSKAPH